MITNGDSPNRRLPVDSGGLIYVVDDDRSIRESVSGLIRAAGMSVQPFASAHEFLAQSRPKGPSCLVLDVQLPGISGLDLQQELSKAGDRIPIIFLTGYGDIPMSVRAIRAGAVEFLTKPFDDENFLSAIRRAVLSNQAVRQQSPNLKPRANCKQFHPFQLDTVNQCLWRQGEGEEDQRILLAPKAFAMLCYLVEHAGRLVTQDELLQALWPDTFVQPEVLKSHVRDIRAALGDDPKTPRFIETLPRRGYQFIATATESRDDGGPTPDSTLRLTGRSQDLDRLRTYRQKALRGERQLVFITGEPGIGKTSLADAFQLQSAAEISDLRIARGQCVETFGSQEPYYPMLEAIGQLCKGTGQDALVQVLTAQAPTWLAQFPCLLKREQRDKLQPETLGAARDRMLREIATALETITAEKPLLLVFEDLQWADTSTVDMLSALARGRRPAKLMIVGTYRPVDVLIAEHPLKAVRQDLQIHHLCQEIALEPLAEAQIAEHLATGWPGVTMPDGLAGLLFRHSEGNPLFMVAVLEHMRARGVISEEEIRWKLNQPLEEIDLRAPDNLRQMVETQIERLEEEERRVLEAASVMGLVFSPAVVATAADLDLEVCESLCERLAQRHQIIEPPDGKPFPEAGTWYRFVHALYREIVYDRVPPVRKAKLHLRIADGLEQLYVDQPGDSDAVLASL